MSELQMDLELVEEDGRRAVMVAEDLEVVLGRIPLSVEGGIASERIAQIVVALAEQAGVLATTARLVGAVLAETVADSRRTDESVAAAFGDAQAAMDGQR